MDIQWYPGHMKRALREIEENIKLIDVVVEILDARIPRASKNPDIDHLARNKERIIVLNKADLANETLTREWERYFKEQGFHCISTDARNRGIKKAMASVIEAAGRAKRERDAKKGIKKRALKLLISGIPNSGKSTFINSYVGSGSAKTGDKPGVTKGKQWITLPGDVQMLDTPGILWPKFEDQMTGVNLALCGSVKGEILNRHELALILLEKLSILSPDLIPNYYEISSGTPEEMLYNITIKRNFLSGGGEPDINRGVETLLLDFRSARLGRITLERCIEDVE